MLFAGWPIVVAMAVVFAHVWMRAQPIVTDLQNYQRPTGIKAVFARFVGWTIRPGIAMTRGHPFHCLWTSWIAWSAIGLLVLTVVLGATGEWTGRGIVLGILAGLGIGVVCGLLAFAGAMAYANATNMSSFEGKSGFFVMGITLLGGLVGTIGGIVGMIWFFSRSSGMG